MTGGFATGSCEVSMIDMSLSDDEGVIMDKGSSLTPMSLLLSSSCLKLLPACFTTDAIVTG